MTEISTIKHANGALGLRLLGLGPKFLPVRGVSKLQLFLNKNTFWAANRNIKQLKRMLANSSVVISLWDKNKLVGFGRATSDKTFRAVLWDIVIDNDLQGIGLGSIVVEALLNAPEIINVEKVYLMTTNCSEFYEQMGFAQPGNQKLLVKKLDNYKPIKIKIHLNKD